ncbi:FecR domain-containing protein [Rufibacter immobilis]|uniref:FecR domain-containing protein n=1 Tax=Rufibacter immobilis TaxID=1348778 RepID=UPI0035EE36C9
MNKDEFAVLVRKYLAGEADNQEKERLLAYYEALQNTASNQEEVAHLSQDMDTKARLYQKILREIKRQERKKSPGRLQWAVAASLLVGILFWGISHYWGSSKIQQGSKAVVAHAPIQAAGDMATLTLGDGSKIILDEASLGELAQQQGVHITKKADGELIYSIEETSARTTGPLAYHTIETPRGGKYQLNLPDGTKVWLNAGTSLRFPAWFAGVERRVELTGEAYFEVAKNKAMPFKVVSGSHTVEVLGTHFNVSAYREEALVKTTLLEGSVRVSVSEQPSTLLHPGQQATIGKAENAFSVLAVDVEDAVAWKNGYFMFKDEGLEGVMRQLGRWYDVEVVYEAKPGDEVKLGGIISRTKSLQETLRVIELSSNVRFKVEGKRVLVLP